MLERVLEPELMDDPHEAQSYNDMDHSEVNRRFVAELLACGELGNDVLDLGTGTALIPIELCEQHATCRVMASDAATSMLDLARYNIAVASMELRIQLHHGDHSSLQTGRSRVCSRSISSEFGRRSGSARCSLYG